MGKQQVANSESQKDVRPRILTFKVDTKLISLDTWKDYLAVVIGSILGYVSVRIVIHLWPMF
jgi:hypothetical protein